MEKEFITKRLVLPKEVYFELTLGNPLIYDWVSKFPNAIVENVEMYATMKDLLNEFPKLASKGNKKVKYHADPHIISLAIAYSNNINIFLEKPTVKIITEEKNAPGKIPWIAAKYGIPSLKLLDYLVEIGVVF